MADYQGQANSIYDPQLQAEQQTLGAEYNANKTSFANEENSANNVYADALAEAGKSRDSAASNADFVAQTHGLFSSGLAANAQRLVYQDYTNNANKLALARAQKLTDVASRRTAEDQTYQSKLGALSSKYQGMKNEYIAEHQNADAKAAAAQAISYQRAAASASSRQPTAAQLKQQAYSSLADDVAGGLNGYGTVRPKGYTEQLIAKLQTAYAPYMSAKDVQNYVYQYRKSKYGD